MIEIKNLRNTKLSEPYDVRVDRSSPLGNIFYMAGEGQRNLVCDQYDKWLLQMITNSNVAVINEINKLLTLHKKYGKLRLFCWCWPKQCHAESIKYVLQTKILTDIKNGL